MGKSLALIAIFCLSACFMSSVSGTETSTSMLRGLQLIQMQTGYVVDDILAFLKSFETDIWNQITHLDEAVRVETEYLEQLIRDLEVQRQNKLQECQGHQTETDTIINEYNKQLDFVNWVTKRINENYEKIENYHKQSCQQTLDFVEYLRNSQNALNLIQFLRQSLTDYSFTQLKPLALILKHYSSDSSLYSTSKGLQMMLVQFQAALHQVDPSQYHSGDSLNDRVHSRTGDEIGQAHIDNDEDNIEVDSFQGGKRMGLHAVKEELFKILDALEAKIKQNMNDRINNMITLAETTAEYIIVLEREIEYLQKELVHQQEVLREIEIRVKESQAIVEQCYVEYEQIVSTIKETKEKHDNYIKDKGAYREVLLDQLDQLTAIINLYETKIASTGENFKTRYDDVLDNNVVDYSAHVDERELKVEYDHLQNPEDLDLSIEDDIVLTPADENDESF